MGSREGSIPIVQMYPTSRGAGEQGSRGAGEQGSRGENRFKFSYIPVHQNIFAKTGCTRREWEEDASDREKRRHGEVC